MLTFLVAFRSEYFGVDRAGQVFRELGSQRAHRAALLGWSGAHIRKQVVSPQVLEGLLNHFLNAEVIVSLRLGSLRA